MRIVVGVDRSDDALTALRWALREARRTPGTTVDVVHVWRPSYSFAPGMAMRTMSDDDERALADGVVDRALHLTEAERDGVEVDRIVTEGHAANVLAQVGTGASMVVVGRHGDGRGLHAAIGSVSHGLLRRATCPVVVIPSDLGDGAGD